MPDTNSELESAKKKIYWDKRIVLLAEIFLSVLSFLFFLFGVYIDNSIIEGISSNCFTAFIVTVIFAIVDWNTETDTEQALKSLERETKARIEDMQTSTNTISEKLKDDIDILEHTINSFSSVVNLYGGKSCTFCKNSIKAVNFDRQACCLDQFFSDAQESICILATNLESFTDYLHIFKKKALQGVQIRIATIHPNFARSFNISNIVGYTGSEKRWSDMRQSLLQVLNCAETTDNRIEVKTYTTITPTLILMMVDDQCYVSYLLHGHRSRETPHFLFTKSTDMTFSPFESFQKHFDGIWNDPGTVVATSSAIYNLNYSTNKYGFVGWQFCDTIYSRGITLYDLYDILVNNWSKETCTPRMKDQWNRSVPYVGQCTITAFLVQDFFGGEVYGIKTEDNHLHSFNIINEHIIDLTSEQFRDGTIRYDNPVIQSKSEHFSSDEKLSRYTLLKEKVEQELSKR